MTAAAYPLHPAARTQWILERRGARNPVDPQRPHAFFVEREPNSGGQNVSVGTILLIGRECPWKCVMCDLWRNTTKSHSEPGAIIAQIESALPTFKQCSVLKLYNSGSFFDPRAVPPSAWPAIAQLCARFDRVIVECHPRLVGRKALEFAQVLGTRLEVALGLETAHEQALQKLNKRFTLRDYASAAAFLRANGINVRTFLLVHPPFLEPGSELLWLQKSLRFAFDCGSEVNSLIPLRHGNGAVELLAREPRLSELEDAQEVGLRMKRGRVFADTWDLHRFATCAKCAGARSHRIERMNLSQTVEPLVRCGSCQ